MVAGSAVLRTRICGIVFLVALLFAYRPAVTQDTGKTVRHHHIEPQDPTANNLTQAESAIEKQDYASAEPLLNAYLQNHPEDYTAWFDLGFLEHALGKREDSIAAYRKSVAAKPDVFESNLNLGLALADVGDAQAEQFLQAATGLNPSSNTVQERKRAWMALGRVRENSKPNDALEAFEKAAAQDPADAEPHLAAGQLLEKEERTADAEKEYRQALNVAPNSTDALIALSNFYMHAKRFADAQTPLQKLVSLHPYDASAHFQLGRILAISGRNDEAVDEMEAGLKLDPSDSKAQRDLADMCSDVGKFDRATQLYTSLLSLNPNDASLHFGLGRVLIKQKNFAQAEQVFMKAVRLNPQWGEAYGELAVAANENKDYVVAIKATDFRGKYLPETPMSYFLRATAYDHLHDAKQAAKYYHQFLDVAGGKYPDQEWQAQHRLIAIEPRK